MRHITSSQSSKSQTIDRLALQALAEVDHEIEARITRQQYNAIIRRQYPTTKEGWDRYMIQNCLSVSQEYRC